jgi:hypothetical protein
MTNNNLTAAKRAKNDEFYTQFRDIDAELTAYYAYNQDVFRDKVVLLPCDDPEWSNFTKFFAVNFDKFRMKKLIGTSYAKDGGRGKKFTLIRDTTGDGRVDIDVLSWEWLDGDGDFRSAEVTALRDEADFVVTNPPFSLFREFLAWIVEADKQFAVIGNMNAITYKEVFPLIKDGEMWLGATGFMSDMVFAVPAGTAIAESDRAKAERLGYVGNYTRLGNSCWFTTIDHGKRHEPLRLMTEADNLRFGRAMSGKSAYERYDNYDAIEVPVVRAIPADYAGVMGVPISFLDKHCPEQFEIVKFRHGDDDKDLTVTEGGTTRTPYFRILVRHTAASLAGAL